MTTEVVQAEKEVGTSTLWWCTDDLDIAHTLGRSQQVTTQQVYQHDEVDTCSCFLVALVSALFTLLFSGVCSCVRVCEKKFVYQKSRQLALSSSE